MQLFWAQMQTTTKTQFGCNENPTLQSQSECSQQRKGSRMVILEGTSSKLKSKKKGDSEESPEN